MPETAEQKPETLYGCLKLELIKRGWAAIAAEHQASKAMKTADGRIQAQGMLSSAGYESWRLNY